jgi:hypothetical protein
MRMEGKRGLVPVTMVENGSIQCIRLAFGIKRRLDHSANPRRKQGGLEFGLLSGQVWQDYAVAIVGRESWDNQPTIVLEVKVRTDPTGGYHKVWVDAETFRVVRRDRLTGDGKLKYRQVFRDPFRSPAGTWLSRRIEIHNQFEKFVGALVLTEIRVNEGLDAGLFRP